MSDYSEHIDRYLNNEMTQEERELFESDVAKNNLLAEELKLQKEMRKVFSKNQWFSSNTVAGSSKREEALLSYLQSDEAHKIKVKIGEVVKNEGGAKTNAKSWFLASAAAIVMLIITTYLLLVPSSPDYQELYTQYVNFDGLPSLLSRGENDESLVLGQLAFEESDYQRAIEHLNNYFLSKSEVNPIGYVYLSLAYLESGDTSSALKELDNLAQSNTLDSKQATWYKAMVYLKTQQKAQLVETLEKITSDQNEFNYGKAKSLLDSLK